MTMDMGIYLAMAVVFLLAVCNVFLKKGLLYLLWGYQALQRATKWIAQPETGNQLRQAILTNRGDPAGELFRQRELYQRMQSYCTNVQQMHLKEHHRSMRDISYYFNDDLLEHFCVSASVEHAASGLTALGMLGTFMGLTSGLAGFYPEGSGEITSTLVAGGISALLRGIGTAFLTSMVGIGLSLLLGFLHRFLRTLAEDTLDAFVDNFHRHVLSDRSEEALNELVDRMDKVRSSMERESTYQLQMLEMVADQFVLRISGDLQLKFDDFRRTMEQTVQEQKNYNEATRNMVDMVQEVRQQMVELSNSTADILGQQQWLSRQLSELGKALEVQENVTHSAVQDSQSVLEQQAGIVERITQCSALLDAMTANVAAQMEQTTKAVDVVTACSKEAVIQHQVVLEEQFHTLQQLGERNLEQLAGHYTDTVEKMWEQVEQRVASPSKQVDYSDLLRDIVIQNSQMLRCQQKLLTTMEQQARKKALFRRTKP